jgi:hypothetical protein
MPCYDGRDHDKSNEVELGRQVKWYQAALCATVTALENNMGEDVNEVADLLDFKEAGINRKDFVEWKQMHDAEDIARRAREAKKAADDNRRKELLASMSIEDRKLLGLR